MKKYLLTALLFLATSAQAELSPTSRAEIDHLFTYLEKSGCQFNRNGSWYSSTDASAHLHEKFNYLIKRNLVSSSENFIERAATESSMSGKAYLVQCAGQKAQASGPWFREELARYRQQAKPATH